MLLHLSLHPLPAENLQHTAVSIMLMTVSCKPELTVMITYIYEYDKSAFTKRPCVVLYCISSFAAGPAPSCFPARFDMQCHV